METVLLLGAIQGFITGIALWLHAGRRNGSHWLALGVLALSLTLFRLWTHATGLESHPLFRRLPLSFDLAIFPLFYLYALSLTAAPARSVRRALAWLSPWALSMGYSLLVYLVGIGEPNIAAMDAVAERWRYPELKLAEDYLTVAMNTVLAALVWLRVSQHHARIEGWVPERFADLLRLLRMIMALALAAALINLGSFAAQHVLGLGERSAFSQAAMAFHVVLVYLAGIIGLRLKDLPRFPDASAEPALPAGHDPQIGAAFQRLQALMHTEQLHTEPELNLNDLARRLGLPAAVTSRVIKEGAGTNFRGYINNFRVETVKHKLRDPGYSGVSILAISLESGFNSESSFYRVFKAATGLSPSAYREQA